ncbi:hypothetical protein KP509_1Z164600 [Ceratopteris richardii]|nr:hypothetical protein KP509_1Z164600 [Ceratopteris richardii]
MTYTRTTGYMPAELMYCQKPILPTESHALAWTSLPWEDEVSREDLLAVRILQLERGKNLVEEAAFKLRASREKNKIAFDKSHRLRPKRLKEGDLVLVYDSSLNTQYEARRKLVKRWFGPYVVCKVFDNGTYSLRELDGTKLKDLIAGKRVKLFKRRENENYETVINEDEEEESEEEGSEKDKDEDINKEND